METIAEGVNVQVLRRFAWHYRELRKIERALHRLDEAHCNGDLTPRQERRCLGLEAKAEAIAQNYSLTAYHQGDPRGCALYLIDPQTMNETNYTDGIAIV